MAAPRPYQMDEHMLYVDSSDRTSTTTPFSFQRQPFFDLFQARSTSSQQQSRREQEQQQQVITTSGATTLAGLPASGGFSALPVTMNAYTNMNSHMFATTALGASNPSSSSAGSSPKITGLAYDYASNSVTGKYPSLSHGRVSGPLSVATSASHGVNIPIHQQHENTPILEGVSGSSIMAGDFAGKFGRILAANPTSTTTVQQQQQQHHQNSPHVTVNYLDSPRPSVSYDRIVAACAVSFGNNAIQQQQQQPQQQTSTPGPGMPPGCELPDFGGVGGTNGTPRLPIAQTDELVKRKGNGFRSMNDRELRLLLTANEGRPLNEVAKEVRDAERTPRAEKTKQLFAMLWLKEACISTRRSTPRGRVYTFYADRCGTEHVAPLNPASFGKLVRVIFPGIQTRRLGVRGESKYHYVDLALRDDFPDSNGRRVSSNSAAQRSQDRLSTSVSNSGSTTSGNSEENPGHTTSCITSMVAPSVGEIAAAGETESSGCSEPSEARIFTSKDADGGGGFSTFHAQILQFPSTDVLNGECIEGDECIRLPDIFTYVPPKTDFDAADALSALYRTHCTSLVDCVRYCKEKQFFRLYTAFPGTLTAPVQKLLGHSAIAPWVRECDWLMYQKMLRFVSRLTLQVAPLVVLRFLEKVAKSLEGFIAKTFTGQPKHLVEAKMEPAVLFASLLQRMLRVNNAAHAAAALLMTSALREQMWTDWRRCVNAKRIIETELPLCGYEEVFEILTRDVQLMLTPPEGDVGSGESETCVDRIAGFLTNLPKRFPGRSARTLLQCISTIMTAVLRDLTMEQAASFNCWWVTKVFVDEMSLWLACLGGFLGRGNDRVKSNDVSQLEGGKENVKNGGTSRDPANTETQDTSTTKAVVMAKDDDRETGRTEGDAISEAEEDCPSLFKSSVSSVSSMNSVQLMFDCDINIGAIGMDLDVDKMMGPKRGDDNVAEVQIVEESGIF